MIDNGSNTLVMIAGRRVRVVRGEKSQTINVCTPANEIGHYEVTYRLAAAVPVTTAELAELSDVAALDGWVATRGGDREVPGRPGVLAVPSVPAPAADDAWVLSARDAVDRAITALVDQFLEDPYLHRVEHSLHVLLHSLLVREAPLSGVVGLATAPHRTQLLHKEWPETIAEPGANGLIKKGNFDIGILAPAQVGSATLEQFRSGRIDAPLAVEVGLDYGLKHLRKDADKLLHSQVQVPYLLHLSRIKVTDQAATEALLCGPEAPLRTAYAHVDPVTGARRWKHIADTSVTSS